MPIERQSDQWPHRCAAMIQAADYLQAGPQGFPRRSDGTYDTEAYNKLPLIDDGWSRRRDFSPTTINPPSSSKTRPDVQWEMSDPEQDPLSIDMLGDEHEFGRPKHSPDYSVPYDRKPVVMYRGINLDLAHPGAAQLRRTLFGGEHESENTDGYLPGMPSDADLAESWAQGDFENPALGQMILDHVTSMRNDGLGLGRHWTRDPSMAKAFSMSEESYPEIPLPIVLRSEWNGAGEDPYRTDTYGNFPESEVTMIPGAPHNITHINVRHPGSHLWNNVLPEPVQHTAALDRIHPSDRDNYEQWRSELPPELAQYYDDHEDLEENDFGRSNNQRRSPWENPEDASVYIGPESFGTPRYPTVESRPRIDSNPDPTFGTDYRFHFSPTEVNPPAKSKARPDLDWQSEELDQDTLPGEWPRGRHTELHRGLTINLDNNEALARALQQNHPDLPHYILDSINQDQGGVGTHWSNDPEVAQGYATNGTGKNVLPVMMTTQWKGAGEDPYRHKSYGDFPGAGEITLTQGADTPISNVSIMHPDTQQWHSLNITEPSTHTAQRIL